MDEKIYTITLEDGTLLEDLRLNGNNFISDKKIDASVFDGRLGRVIINDGESDEIHTNMALVQVDKMGDEYWFVLRDVSAEEIANAKLRADLDYLAMMTDIEF